MATASDGYRVTRLQDMPFTSGGTVSIQTAGQIPPGRDVVGVKFKLDCDLTQPAAAMVAQLGAVLHQLIAQVKIGRRVSVTGLGLKVLSWMMFGRESNFPAGLPGVANNVLSRSVEWDFWYADPGSRAPNDGVVPSLMWQDPIEVRFGTNAIFAATAPTIGNATLRTYVIHQASQADDDTAVVPVSLNVQTEDFNALTATINKVGRWVYAAAFREASADAGGITNVQVSNLVSYVDGEPILNALRASDAAAVYNSIGAVGSALRVESLTIPHGGEIINSQPGVAAAAGQGVLVDFLPLIFPGKPYLVSECPEATVGAKFDFTGTLGAYKIVYRIVEPRAMQNLGNAGRKLGIGDATVEIKTLSKANLNNPRLAPYLPVRLRRKFGA